MYMSIISLSLLISGLLDTSSRCVLGSPAGKATENEPPKCGLSTITSGGLDLVGKGTKGEAEKKVASEGDFPWHAVIYHERSEKWEQVCGGTLVTPRIVLTGAICVTENMNKAKLPETLKVALGKLSRSWDKKDKNQVIRDVSQVQVHPNFFGSSTNFAFDMALLTLDSDVPISNFIGPACVDFTSKYVRQFNEDKSLKGFITGFGSRDSCREVCEPVEELKYVETNVLNYKTCVEAMAASRKPPVLRIAADHFCVGNGTVSPIQRGDSGGGLTLVFNGLHYVFGVISVKLKLEMGDKLHYSYGGLTSVPSNIEWLKNQLY